MFLYSHEPLQLNRYLIARTHQRHARIALISPFYEPSYFSEQHFFGRFLYRSREDGAEILIIVRELFRETETLLGKLEAVGAECFVLPTLHSKVYIFDVGQRQGSRFQRSESEALFGSANMTTRGWRLDDCRGNDEVCVRLTDRNVRTAYQYARRLARKSKPYIIARRERLRSWASGMGENDGR